MKLQEAGNPDELKYITKFIRESVILEISGALRKTTGKPQHRIGKIEDENRELSFAEAEQMFPGSTDSWVEVVPDLYPDFPFPEYPIAIKRGSSFFKIGDKLRVAFKEMPQIELAQWEPDRDDWVELEA